MKAADGPLASSYKPSTDQKSPSNIILCSVAPLQFYHLIRDPGSSGDLVSFRLLLLHLLYSSRLLVACCCSQLLDSSPGAHC